MIPRREGRQALLGGLGSVTPTWGLHDLTPLPGAVSVPPQVQLGPRVLKVLAGEILDLNCVAEGSPEPRLNWSKDGVTLQSGGPEGSVHFSAIQTSDAGVYRCEASNSAGVDAWELELRVLGECPPNSRTPPTAARASEMRDPCLPPSLQCPEVAALSLVREARGYPVHWCGQKVPGPRFGFSHFPAGQL